MAFDPDAFLASVGALPELPVAAPAGGDVAQSLALLAPSDFLPVSKAAANAAAAALPTPPMMTNPVAAPVAAPVAFDPDAFLAQFKPAGGITSDPFAAQSAAVDRGVTIGAPSLAVADVAAPAKGFDPDVFLASVTPPAGPVTKAAELPTFNAPPPIAATPDAYRLDLDPARPGAELVRRADPTGDFGDAIADPYATREGIRAWLAGTESDARAQLPPGTMEADGNKLTAALAEKYPNGTPGADFVAGHGRTRDPRSMWEIANTPFQWAHPLVEEAVKRAPELAPWVDVSGANALAKQLLPAETYNQLTTGAARGIGHLAEGFASPLGVGALGLGGWPKAVQKAAALLFAADMAKHAPDALAAIGDAQTTEERAQAVTEAIGTGAMLYGAARHGLGRESFREGAQEGAAREEADQGAFAKEVDAMTAQAIASGEARPAEVVKEPQPSAPAPVPPAPIEKPVENQTAAAPDVKEQSSTPAAAEPLPEPRAYDPAVDEHLGDPEISPEVEQVRAEARRLAAEENAQLTGRAGGAQSPTDASGLDRTTSTAEGDAARAAGEGAGEGIGAALPDDQRGGAVGEERGQSGSEAGTGADGGGVAGHAADGLDAGAEHPEHPEVTGRSADEGHHAEGSAGESAAPLERLPGETEKQFRQRQKDARTFEQKKKAFAFSRRIPASATGDDVIDRIAALGRMAPWGKAKGRVGTGGEWDGYQYIPKGVWHHALFHDGSMHNPDGMAQMLYDSGHIKENSPDAMWQAIIDAIKRRRANADAAHAQAAEWVQGKKFVRDAQTPRKGEKTPEHTGDELNKGDTITVKGEKFTVTKIDPDTGAVTLSDGETYGVQRIAGNEVIYGRLKRGPKEDTGNADVPFARRSDAGRAEPVGAAIPRDDAAVEGFWRRVFHGLAPGAAKQLRLFLRDPEALVDAGLVKPEQLTGRERAAYVARLRSIFLLDRSVDAKLDDATVLNLVHESGHAWWDTLKPEVRDALTKLWKAETEGRTGPLYDGGELKPGVADGVARDPHEWFAERAAIANFEWAKKRTAAAASDGSILGRAAAALRSAWTRVRELRGDNPDALNGRLRRFLDRGAKAYNTPPRFVASNAQLSAPGIVFVRRAFHGTPHEIDPSEGFKTDKIGTGEGSQVFGWGLYFAEEPGVAASYARTLGKPTKESGQAWQELLESIKEDDLLGFDSARQAADALVKDAIPQEHFDLSPRTIKALAAYTKSRGNRYTVDLDVDPEHLLDWDKPLKDQSAKVKQGLERWMAEPDWADLRDQVLNPQNSGEEIYRALNRGFASGLQMPVEDAAARSSQALSDFGIPGIRYLDRGSRPYGEGTHNYVIFDESKIRIAEKNGEPITPREAVAAGGSDVRFSRRPPAHIPTDAEIGDPPGVRVPRGFSRLYLGAADVLERTPGLEFLGRAVRRHVDQARRYQGALTAPFRAWEAATPRRARKAALREFENYQQARVTNGELFADGIRRAMGPAGQELLGLWQESARRMQTRNELAGVLVKEEGRWRPERSLGENYFPRMIRPDIAEKLQQMRAKPEFYRELVKDLVKEGLITDAKEAREYLERATSTESRFDTMGNIERARRLPLPHRVYDYSFNAARRYIMMWSERMAQIEAFGQKTTAESKNLFDIARDRAAGDQDATAYVDAVEKRAFNESKHDPVARTMRNLATAATGLQLANPRTVGVNVISGLAETTWSMGLRHSLRGAMELRSLKRLGGAIDDAHGKGVLLDDLMNLAHDADNTQSSSLSRKLQALTGGALKWSGYNLSEQVLRAHSFVTARAFLRDALRVADRRPGSRADRVYRAWFERNSLDFDKLRAEGDAGAAADRFYRRAVNTSQGGYRYDQVPVFMDSPTGRFLFKYQKWGSQATRNFMLNVIDPLTRPGAGPRQIAPAIRWALSMLAAGTVIQKFKELTFGTPASVASINEIAKTAKADERRALALSMSRLFRTMLAASAGGLLGNYAQTVSDVAERSRFKNPMEPPPLGPVKALWEQVMRGIEQGKLTIRDLDDFARSLSSQYATGKQIGARAVEAAAGKSEPAWARNEVNRQEGAWLNSITRRFSDELGIAGRRTEIGRVGKMPDSAVKAELHDALLAGDVAAARAAMKDYLAGFTSDAQRAVALRSLSASVRATQPIRVGGVAAADRRELFMDWARKRLEPEDLARIRRLDRNYLATAEALGLMREPKELGDDKLDAAMQRKGWNPATTR